MTRSLAEVASLDAVVGACVEDPERWMTAVDEHAKAMCRHCPRRWLCAREACEMPRAEGIWAGVFIPEAGRGRTHALRRLRSLAERGAIRCAGRRGDRRDSGGPVPAGPAKNSGQLLPATGPGWPDGRRQRPDIGRQSRPATAYGELGHRASAPAGGPTGDLDAV